MSAEVIKQIDSIPRLSSLVLNIDIFAKSEHHNVVLSFHPRIELVGCVVRALVPSPFASLGWWSVVSFLTFAFALFGCNLTDEDRCDEHHEEFDDSAHVLRRVEI
jgi:hypothetical protein